MKSVNFRNTPIALFIVLFRRTVSRLPSYSEQCRNAARPVRTRFSVKTPSSDFRPRNRANLQLSTTLHRLYRYGVTATGRRARFGRARCCFVVLRSNATDFESVSCVTLRNEKNGRRNRATASVYILCGS